MNICKLRVFKLSDLEQGIHKDAIQMTEEFLPFLKKVIERKGKKKINISVSRTTLYTQIIIIKFCMQVFFLKNVCLSRSFSFRLKKKSKKDFGQFQNYLARNVCCRHQKVASHTISNDYPFFGNFFSFLINTIHQIFYQNKKKVL